MPCRLQSLGSHPDYLRCFPSTVGQPCSQRQWPLRPAPLLQSQPSQSEGQSLPVCKANMASKQSQWTQQNQVSKGRPCTQASRTAPALIPAVPSTPSGLAGQRHALPRLRKTLKGQEGTGRTVGLSDGSFATQRQR